MEWEQIVYQKQEGIATITLNRPERMNALTNRMLDEWVAALEDARADQDVKAVILRGAGRGFWAGMDVRAAAAGEGLLEAGPTIAARRNNLRDTVQRVLRTAATLEKPYLAAVNGAAVGAGMDMAAM